MSTLLKPFSDLISTIQAVWKRLIQHIDKDTAKLVFVTLTVLIMFETILLSLLIALFFLRAFLST